MSDAGPSLRMHAVVIDCPEFAPLIAFWSAALGYVEWFAPFDQFAGIKPPDGRGGLPIIFQRVPEPKVVKNRVHLDYEADAMEAEVDRLVGLGGRSIGSWRWARRCAGPSSRTRPGTSSASPRRERRVSRGDRTFGS